MEGFRDITRRTAAHAAGAAAAGLGGEPLDAIGRLLRVDRLLRRSVRVGLLLLLTGAVLALLGVGVAHHTLTTPAAPPLLVAGGLLAAGFWLAAGVRIVAFVACRPGGLRRRLRWGHVTTAACLAVAVVAYAAGSDPAAWEADPILAWRVRATSVPAALVWLWRAGRWALPRMI